MKAGLFVFSGTGNTERVAVRLADALRRRGIASGVHRIDRILKEREAVDYGTYDLLGIGHPVLGFGATGLLERFVRMLPAGAGKPAFVFKTASSPHYLNHGASEGVIRILRENGYDPFHNSIVAMPCNFFMRYDDRLNKQLDRASVRIVEGMADEIAAGTRKELRIHPLLASLFRQVNKGEEQYGAKYWVKGLRVSAACTSCGRCVRDCPMDNIRLGAEEGIRFGESCIWCMRCIYSCPAEAIEATRLRSSVVRPYTGGPALDRLEADESNDGGFVTEQSRGYYRHMIGYLLERK